MTSPDETLVYDVDGNLIECANAGEIAPGGGRRVTYSWDAENRLTVVEPVTAQSGDRKVKDHIDQQYLCVKRSIGKW